jgi:uncharacterized protein YkuJ
MADETRRYIVRETVTLVRYIDAKSEADALAQVKDMSAADFDEIDCSVPENITIKLDSDA